MTRFENRRWSMARIQDKKCVTMIFFLSRIRLFWPIKKKRRKQSATNEELNAKATEAVPYNEGDFMLIPFLRSKC